jgi:hypothetical protein
MNAISQSFDTLTAGCCRLPLLCKSLPLQSGRRSKRRQFASTRFGDRFLLHSACSMASNTSRPSRWIPVKSHPSAKYRPLDIESILTISLKKSKREVLQHLLRRAMSSPAPQSPNEARDCPRAARVTLAFPKSFDDVDPKLECFGLFAPKPSRAAPPTALFGSPARSVAFPSLGHAARPVPPPDFRPCNIVFAP